MKKVIYASFLNEDIRPGYKEKIHAQCRAMSNLECETYLLIVNNKGLVFYNIKKDEEVIVSEHINTNRFFSKRNLLDELKLFKKFINILSIKVNTINPDLIYVRRILPIIPLLVKTLGEFKEKGIKVYYEYPTYPWEKEMLVQKQYFFYIIDKFFFKKLYNSVDKFVIIGDSADANSNKFISISNAIDISVIEMKKQKKEDHSDVLNLIGIAHVSYFHGYDRIIDGLKQYYDKVNTPKQVKFHIVGPVSKELGLKEKVREYKLDTYVEFWGYQKGEDLNNIVDKCDIGIGCLALHRKNLKNASSLKNREYVARGLPLIYSEVDETIEMYKPEFILKVPESESPVNIGEIIDFHEKTFVTPIQIRTFAEKNLTWENQMSKVLDSL